MTFDLTCRNESIGHKLQKDVRHYVVPHLEDELDTAVNAVMGPDDTLVIPHLEIDLGVLTPATFSSSGILARLCGLLKEAIQRKKKWPAKESALVLPNKERDYQLIDYFLQHGDLPWWTDKTGKIEMDELLSKVVENDPVAWQQLLNKHLHNPIVWQRIALQLRSFALLSHGQWESTSYERFLQIMAQPDSSTAKRYRHLLVKQMVQQPGWIKQLKNSIVLFEKEKTKRGREIARKINKKTARLTLRKMSAYEIAFLHRKQFPLPNDTVIIQREAAISVIVKQLRNISKRGIEILRHMTDADLAYLEELFTTLKKEEQKRIILQESLLGNDDFLQLNLLQLSLSQLIVQRLPDRIIQKYKKIFENKTSQARERKKIIESMFKKLSDNDIEALHALSVMPGEQLQKLNQQDVVSDFIADNEGEQRIIVENAGLCLVAGYLPALFRMTGLTRNEMFPRKSNAEKAIQLLQYIASGSHSDPEYLLQLNKILCGIEPGESVRRYKSINKKYTQEADDLLRSLITNWKALRNTTIDGLRHSFLLRKGILREGVNGWVLQVESKGHDVLLSSIPWSYSLIKLPWMKKPIHVEWVLG